jgi:hypothetical protein
MQKQKLLVTLIFLVTTLSAHWVLGVYPDTTRTARAPHVNGSDEAVAADAYANSADNPAAYADDLEDEALILKRQEQQRALEATKAVENNSQNSSDKCSCKNCKCCKKEQRKQKRDQARGAKKDKSMNAGACDACNK